MLKKIQLLLFFIVVTSVVTTGLVAAYFMNAYSDEMNRNLLVTADALFEKEWRAGVSFEEAAQTCQRVFLQSGRAIRMTIVASDGTVVYDSNEPSEEMENHADREEIADAIRSKDISFKKRFSNTLGVQMLYMAKYHESADLVVRTSIPMLAYKDRMLQMRGSLFGIMLIALLVYSLLGYHFARKWTRPLISLKNSTEMYKHSNYFPRIQNLSDDEVGILAAAFNNMADDIEKKLQDLETQNRKLALLEEMRAEFVANVSHELKTPLTSIRGFIDTLRNTKIEDPAVAERFLEIIDIEAERLHQLINDILQLSEIETMGKGDEEARVFELDRLVADVAQDLKKTADQKNTIISVEPSESLPVLADPYRIRQVLINLLDNAIKYGKEDGRISIHVRREPDRFVSIQVSDDGEGIDEEHLERVFERFYRVDKSRSREVGGTGLGLSIVKHIAQLYEGSVSVKSPKGAGATFTVHLKIAEDLL